MFPNRMARKLPVYLLLFLITLICVATAAPHGLPAELSSFVPACAAQCFYSFLDVSFEDRPPLSLASLCPRIGVSSFTIGEAAVQCLVAERAVGHCSNKEASDGVINKAYWMCNGQPRAVLPSHRVITATLAIPKYGSAPVTFPATKTNGPTTVSATRSTSSSLSLPTTLVTDTASFSFRPSSTRLSSTSFTNTRSTSVYSRTDSATTATTTSTTETNTSTNVPVGIDDGKEGKQNPEPLSPGQIAGLTVGVIAGVAFIAIGIAIFCRYLRRKKLHRGRKRRKHRRSPSGDSWGYNVEKGPNSGPTDSWIANQLRAPLDPDPVPPPKPYSRASWRPSAIGLAISPSNSQAFGRAATPTRPLSKLLPAKPVMAFGGPNQDAVVRGEEETVPLRTAAAGVAVGAVAMTGAVAVAGAAAASRSTESRPAASGPAPGPAWNQAASVPVALVPGAPATASGLTAPGPAIQTRNLTPRSKPQPPPFLKLQIPKAENSKPVVPVTGGRESSTTEFEEDGRTSLSPGGLIWRPPSTDPMTATTYYVADGNGNWVLGDPKRASRIAELAATVSPMTAGPKSAVEPKLAIAAGVGVGVGVSATGAAGFMIARSKDKGDKSKGGKPAKSTEPSKKPPVTILTPPPTQTIRAVEPSVSPEDDLQQPYVPRPLFSTGTNPRRSSTNHPSSTRSLTRPRVTSADSGITTITTSSEDLNDLEPPPPMEQQGNLSPVAESPANGRSPVSYPKIPGRDKNTKTGANLTVPPPMRPFAKQPPGQPSPTLGTMPSRQPLGVATMSSYSAPRPAGKRVTGPRPIESPGALRTGSPTMRVVEPSPEPEPNDRNQLPSSQRHLSSVHGSQDPRPRQSIQQSVSFQQHPQQHPQQQRHSAYQRQHPPNNTHPYQILPHPSSQRGYLQPSPFSYPNRQSQPPPPSHFNNPTFNLPPRPHPNRYPYHHPRNHQPPFSTPHLNQANLRQQQQPDLYPPQLTISNSQIRPYNPSSSADPQSLLAKRLGSDRAANMAISATTQSRSSTQDKWRRQDGNFVPATPRQKQQQQQQEQQQIGELPATPVWVPKLTPTRRGDNLYLNVQ